MALSDSELERALRMADEAGNTADARALAQEWKRRQSVQSQPATTQEDVGGFMPFVNKAIAQTAGAPVDLTNWALSKVGLGSEQPLGGSESIRSGMSAIGAPTPDRAPETFAETLGQVAGEAATFGAGGLKAAQMVARAPRLAGTTTGRLAEDITRAAVERPGATLATEAAAVVGAGAGREAARQNELSPGGQALAETAGALLGGGATLIPSVAGMVTKGAASAGKRAALTFSERGAFDRASARVQEVVADPELAAKRIEDLKGSNLLPSARTEDPGLMTLEAAVFSRDPAESTRIARRTAESVQELAGKIRQSGDVSTPRRFLEAKKERLFSALDARVEQAGEDVVRALELDDSLLDTQGIQSAVRESLDSALADAKAQETMLWEAVPKNVKVSARNTLSKFKELNKNLPEAQKGDMPGVARQLMSGRKGVKAVRLAEMDGLYKKLGEVATKARAAPNADFNQARIAEELREAIMEDMGTIVSGPEDAKQALDTARAFSRRMNEKFRRGTVGKVLGFAREGGGKIPPERTLEVSVAQPGTRGSLAARDIQKAAPDELTLEAIQSYMRRRFMETTIDDAGNINPARANSFMQKHSELLRDFPVLNQQLKAAQTADDVARRVRSSAEAFKRKLDKPSVSTTALFLNAPVNKEIPKVMASPNPARRIDDLVRSARRAPNSKEVMDGLRAGFSQWLLDSSTSNFATDIAGNLKVSGARMQSLLKNAENERAFKSLFSKEQREGIQKYIEEMAKMANQAKFKGSKMPIIDDLPARFIELPARYMGAKLATMFTKGNAGTSLQAAQMGSKEAQRLLRKMNVGRAEQMIIDAMEDPELMKALLLNRKQASKNAVGRANRKINSWLGGVGARLIEDDEEE